MSEPGTGEGVIRERLLDDALACCYRHLARREHSVAELRGRLERDAFATAIVDEAVAVVVEQGYVNDARYARLLVEDRRTIDGWGVERLRARLESAGIDRELIDATLAECDTESERAAATELIRRRCALPLTDDRQRQRAFGILIRQGYESEVAYDAVRAVSAGGGGGG